jgi:hypothetical protein
MINTMIRSWVRIELRCQGDTTAARSQLRPVRARRASEAISPGLQSAVRANGVEANVLTA